MIIFLHHKLLIQSFLCPKISSLNIIRFYPGSSNKLPKNPKEVAEALNTITGAAPISPKPPIFPTSHSPSTTPQPNPITYPCSSSSITNPHQVISKSIHTADANLNAARSHLPDSLELSSLNPSPEQRKDTQTRLFNFASQISPSDDTTHVSHLDILPENSFTEHSAIALQELHEFHTKRKILIQINKDTVFLQDNISTKEIISEDNLKSILLNFQKACKTGLFTKENQESCLHLMRTYFKLNPPSLEIAHIFLDIWVKCHFKFKPLTPIVTEINTTLPIKNKPVISNTLDKNDYQEKKDDALNKASDICKEINALFLRDNNENILYSTEINKWYEYIETRSNIIPLLPEEIAIYNQLKLLKEKTFPKEEDLLLAEKDKLKFLKKDSKLPLSLQTKIKDECFLPEDYVLQIKYIKEALIYLKIENISENDLKLLSINSSATIIDEEGNHKITQQAYKSLKEHSEVLGFKYLNNYPQVEHIMSKIRDKKFVIVKDISLTQDSIVSVAHLSHKTLIVHDDNLGKNVYVRVGMSTSTKDGSTIQIDIYQFTNIDVTKQNKDQMFRIPSTFIVVDEKEPLLVDIEMTLYFHGKNSNGEDITDILVREFELRKSIWANNPYQLTYSANKDFIRKLTLIFYEKKLQQLEKEAQELNNELDNLLKEDSKKNYEKKIENCTEAKEKRKNEKEAQRSFSLLPENSQKLEKCLRIMKAIMKKDQELEKEKEVKEHQKSLLEKLNAKKKEEEQNPVKTAKQKKEEYLKHKQLKEQQSENHVKKDN